MIAELYEYYLNETKRPDSKMSRLGWTKSNVSFAICLDSEGNVVNVVSLMDTKITKEGKSLSLPRPMLVPYQATRTGSAYKAYFLCDNAAYLLGIDVKTKDGESETVREANQKRAYQCFLSTKQLHLELLDSLDTIEVRAIIQFFDKWDPSNADKQSWMPKEPKDKQKFSTSNFVFRVKNQFPLDNQQIQEKWQNFYDSSIAATGEKGLCMVTGKESYIARTHDFVKGLPGAKSTGASFVSVNFRSAESYGKEQAYNSPISKEVSFGFTTALNYLLSDYGHRQMIGGMTVVSWAVSAEPEYQDIFGFSFCGTELQVNFTKQDLDSAMESLAQGRPYNFRDRVLCPDMQYYVLGVSPNAARVSVRLFYHNSFGTILDNVDKHHKRLEIIHSSIFKRYLSIQDLIDEVEFRRKKEEKDNQIRKEEDRNKNPLLESDLYTAILSNSRYPITLYEGIILRITADQIINWQRAAIIKAVLLKMNENKKSVLKEVLTVELNQKSEYLPYVLGRTFAILEAIQRCASDGKLSTTIKDRYFTSASSTPAVVFPTLFRLEENHMKKLKRDKSGLAITLQKRLGGLTVKVHQTYPKHLSLEEQGAFILGYYHETQERFKKIDSNNQEEENEQ